MSYGSGGSGGGRDEVELVAFWVGEGPPSAAALLDLVELHGAEFEAVFARWRAALVAQFEHVGVAPERPAVLAEPVMSAIEGALVLSRAARGPEPYRTTVEALTAIVD